MSVVGGIIRFMKRILILVVVIVMSTSSLQPANAIFGLSKCEKVKKEIQALEKSFNSKQSSWTKYQNAMLPKSMESTYLKYMNTDQVSEIWKIAYNNPKCFTRTQNLQVKSLRGLGMSDFIEDMPKLEIRTDEPKCQILAYQIKNLDFCKLRKGIYIGSVFSMESIYNF
jgi:hypothetical protein